MVKKRKKKACIKMNITQPPDWAKAFRRQAKIEGVNMSVWLGECGLANLSDKDRDGLSARPLAHRPKNKETKV